MKPAPTPALCFLALGLAAAGGCAAMAARDAAMKTAMAKDAAAAPPMAAAAVAQPQLDPVRQKRVVIYNAAIHLVVQHISDALAQIKTSAEQMGGHMEAMSGKSITVRVPAEKFHDAIAAIEALGEVTKKEIKGTDVTDQVRDLDIRLENAQKLRERLLKLLERSDKVEDALEVEKELGRVTETVELLKGKLRHIRNQVAYSTITVHLNSPLPQRELELAIPFEWVRELGRDLARGTVGRPSRWQRPWWLPEKLALPPAYVTYYESRSTLRAMSADGVMVLLERHRNHDRGELGFWAPLVRRALVDKQAIALDEPAELRLRTGVPARLFAGHKTIGGKNFGYLCAVVARPGHVYTIQAWGPAEALEGDREKLEKAIRSLRVGPFHRKLLALLF
ncbi:MAG: DUF4349 domain-containing protein [Candidatus Brocadiia bacterium]